MMELESCELNVAVETGTDQTNLVYQTKTNLVDQISPNMEIESSDNGGAEVDNSYLKTGASKMAGAEVEQ